MLRQSQAAYDRLAQHLQLWLSPGNQFQIDIDSRQLWQVAHLPEASARRRIRVKRIDCKAIVGCQLIEQLLDIATASAMLCQQKYTHAPATYPLCMLSNNDLIWSGAARWTIC